MLQFLSLFCRRSIISDVNKVINSYKNNCLLLTINHIRARVKKKNHIRVHVKSFGMKIMVIEELLVIVIIMISNR